MKTKLKNNLPRFIKTGLAVIATLLLTAIITDKVTGGAVNAALEANAIFTSATSLFREKELPIYCVKTDKKQIALTFDGAWGDGRYGHMRKEGSFHSPSGNDSILLFSGLISCLIIGGLLIFPYA